MPTDLFALPADTRPVCVVLPSGVEAASSGTTVASLALYEGYYRTSNQSRIILECFNKKACKGGTDADDYCTIGFGGSCKYPIERV